VFQLGDLVLGVRNALVDGLNGESINDIELILLVGLSCYAASSCAIR
jgi:hypothetical protein